MGLLDILMVNDMYFYSESQPDYVIPGQGGGTI